MGEAKRRGSYDERKADGIIRRSAAEALRREKLAAIEAARTPKEKAEQNRRVVYLIYVICGWLAFCPNIRQAPCLALQPAQQGVSMSCPQVPVGRNLGSLLRSALAP